MSKLATRWTRDPGVFEVVEKVKPKRVVEMYVLTDADWDYLREAGSGDHFYGAWKGGSAKSGGGPAPAGEDVTTAVKGLRSEAEKAEPEVTALLQGVADSTGGRMEGLGNRLKTEESLARKVQADMVEKHIGAKEAAAGINDHLRYTIVSKDDKTYTDQYKAASAKLAAKGYKPLTTPKSFWNDGVPPPPAFQGVNAVFVNGAGHRFELQFHTEGSLKSKAVVHPHYETWRTAKSPQVRAKEWATMASIQAKVPKPDGWPPSGFDFRNFG